MQASHILHADVLDIIFENRNKAYGAYTLRKFYSQKVWKSLAIVTVLLGIFCFIVLTTKNAELYHSGKEIDIAPVNVKPKIPTPVTKVVPPVVQSNKKLSDKFVLVDSTQKIDSLIPDEHLAVSGPVHIGAQPIYSANANGGDDSSPATPPSLPPAPVAPVVPVNMPLEKADVDPAFPGGLKALVKFLERNLVNPEEISENESISVKVKFVVGYDGELKSFDIKEDGGKAFNDEVIRVLKKMPRWIPGKTNGQNVSVYFTIPVKFINGQ